MGHPMVCAHMDTLSLSDYRTRVYMEHPWVTQWSVHTRTPSPKVTIEPEYTWNTHGSPNGLCTHGHVPSPKL